MAGVTQTAEINTISKILVRGFQKKNKLGQFYMIHLLQLVQISNNIPTVTALFPIYIHLFGLLEFVQSQLVYGAWGSLVVKALRY